MGSSSFLKLIASILVAGFMFLNIHRLTADMNANSNERVLDSINTQNANAIIQLLEFDLNRLGLGVNRQEYSIIQAQPHLISFFSDFDENGVIERVTYSLSDSTVASQTENPNDRVLYRTIDSNPDLDLAMGVTRFDLRYFDWHGYETANLQQIKTIEVTLECQSIVAYDDYYSTFRWHKYISPPNIRRY
ncbi:hypothetical protein GF406_23780 [candidate division KSB1 bacterium]|nr:hypothetical protein [candidate division KSB1 bacterium]